MKRGRGRRNRQKIEGGEKKECGSVDLKTQRVKTEGGERKKRIRDEGRLAVSCMTGHGYQTKGRD